MERKQSVSVGDVLRLAVEQCDMSARLDECRAVELWSSVAGDHIASRCRRPVMSKGVMTVGVANAALRHELSMSRSSIARAINSLIGRKVVADIRFTG